MPVEKNWSHDLGTLPPSPPGRGKWRTPSASLSPCTAWTMERSGGKLQRLWRPRTKQTTTRSRLTTSS
eukprot:14295818-Heterocapsa_arctica.AAC.1